MSPSWMSSNRPEQIQHLWRVALNQLVFIGFVQAIQMAFVAPERHKARQDERDETREPLGE
ncbi:hypothetical protein D3C72_1086430 [compost metagenome]